MEDDLNDSNRVTKELEIEKTENSRLNSIIVSLQKENKEILKIKEIIKNPYTQYPNDNVRTLRKHVQKAIKSFLSDHTKHQEKHNPTGKVKLVLL